MSTILEPRPARLARPGRLSAQDDPPVKSHGAPSIVADPAPAAARTVPRWQREVVVLGGLYAIYEASRGIASSDPAQALARGRGILNWERAWDLAPEASLNHLLAHVTPLAVLAAYFYSTLHYVVTPAVLVWMYRRQPGHYRSARTSLALGTALGLIGFYLLPTAPPRLLPGSGLRDTLAGVSRWGWWSSEGSVPRGLGGLSNQLAAMPSLHVGWALWSGVLVARYAIRRWVRWLGALYPLATTLVVLATGNHYLLDAIGGAGVMALGVGAARLLRTFLGTRPVAAPTTPHAFPNASRAPSSAGQAADTWAREASNVAPASNVSPESGLRRAMPAPTSTAVPIASPIAWADRVADSLAGLTDGAGIGPTVQVAATSRPTWCPSTSSGRRRPVRWRRQANCGPLGRERRHCQRRRARTERTSRIAH